MSLVFEIKIVSSYTQIKIMQFIYYVLMVTFFFILVVKEDGPMKRKRNCWFAIQVKKRLNVSTKAIRYAVKIKKHYVTGQ